MNLKRLKTLSVPEVEKVLMRKAERYGRDNSITKYITWHLKRRKV